MGHGPLLAARRVGPLCQLADPRAGAPGERRRGGERGELLAGGELARRVGALEERGEAVGERAEQRLGRAAQRAAAVELGGGGERRQQRRDPGRDRAKLAQPPAAGQAGAQVGTGRAELLGARLAVGDPRDQRREPLALGPRLDPLDPGEERLAALGSGSG